MVETDATYSITGAGEVDMDGISERESCLEQIVSCEMCLDRLCLEQIRVLNRLCLGLPFSCSSSGSCTSCSGSSGSSSIVKCVLNRLCLVKCVLNRLCLVKCAGPHHVEDDRVQQEGALQPRLVPLRVHEGGVARTCTETSRRARCRRRARARRRGRAPLWNDTKKKRLFGPGDESGSGDHRASHIISAGHRASKKKKPKLIQPGKRFRSMFGIFPEFRGLLQDAVVFYRYLEVEIKNNCNHFGRHGNLRGLCDTAVRQVSQDTRVPSTHMNTLPAQAHTWLT